ncbi:MAG: helix-turn-helix domain-containing protein [Saprospiraceae bacterium]|nr:helix-turn-helix domain-containing protein [Saprospiraceae bacterium]
MNMSSSEENEYFSDGITEEIINALAKIEGLKVTSRTSAFYFKGKNIPIPQIGSALGVSILLEGSVRLAGNAMRITAQLIDAAEDFHFWSETWDRTLDNVFEVQDEISLFIAERLREHFGHLEIQDHLVEVKTQSVEAYQLYLKGRKTFNKWNPDDVKTSLGFYQQALKIDPNHTESILGLADAYSFLGSITAIPFEEGWSKSAALTQRALSINDKLPDAYYQLANLAFFTKGDYGTAFKHIQKALEISPNHPESQQFITFLYIIAGKEREAKTHLSIALSNDPFSPEVQFYSAYVDYMTEAYEDALHQLDQCLTINPMNIPVHTIKTVCLLKLGKYDEAIHYYDTMPKEIVLPGENAGIQALGYTMKKDAAKAAAFERQLVELSDAGDFIADTYRFLLAAVANKLDDAFAWVENAMKNGSPLLLYRYGDPLVNALKQDNRYTIYHSKLFPGEVFGLQKKASHKKPLLTEEAAADSKKKLLEMISAEKPYLDPDLTLRKLAEQLDLHPNQLSWLLNDGFGKNFNEFINHYRIEAFKVMARDPKNSHLTIMAIAYDTGFNSKTVFNTFFKKETGTTPKQFLQG